MMNKMTDESIKIIDPNILLSIINTKLRDQFSSLEQLCYDLDVTEDNLVNKLRAIGKEYDRASNQFK